MVLQHISLTILCNVFIVQEHLLLGQPRAFLPVRVGRVEQGVHERGAQDRGGHGHGRVRAARVGGGRHRHEGGKERPSMHGSAGKNYTYYLPIYLPVTKDR